MRRSLVFSLLLAVLLAASLPGIAAPGFDAQVAALGSIDPQATPATFANAALALAPTTPEERKTSATLKLAAGDALLGNGGSVATARRLYDAALAELRKDGQDLVEPLRHIGEQLLAANQASAAVPYLTRAITLLGAARPDDPALRFLLADLADADDRLGNTAEAARLRAQIAELDGQAANDRVPQESTAYAPITPPAPIPPPAPPPPPPPPSVVIPRGGAEVETTKKPQEPFQVVPVFFQTTRKAKGLDFGTERDANVNSGIAYVSVPRQREVGSVPRPSVWRLDFAQDPARHVILRDIQRLGDGDFGARLAGRIRRSERGEALIFVHGFNQSFADGMRTAAALSVDLEIDGATIAFSWPSKENVFFYNSDVTEVDAAANRKALAALLVRATRLGAKHVYVVAHSLGNRMLLNAMADAKSQLAGRAFDDVVFGSPDVDASDFRQRVQALSGLAKHMTLYAGATDRALMLSGFVHGGAPRAGDIAANVASTPFLEVIDATLASADFLGHDDYAWLARDDLKALVWFGSDAKKRCVLRSGPLRWKYQPSQACPTSAFGIAARYLRRAGSIDKALAALARDEADGIGISEADLALARMILQRLTP